MSETEILDTILKRVDSTQETLREILKWIRFANFQKLRETLETELDTNEKKAAYDNSDGANGIKELAAFSGAPQDTIYAWWQKWFRAGLVTESETRKGRMRKIASLDEVGLKPARGKSGTPSSITTKISSKIKGEKT